MDRLSLDVEAPRAEIHSASGNAVEWESTGRTWNRTCGESGLTKNSAVSERKALVL